MTPSQARRAAAPCNEKQRTGATSAQASFRTTSATIPRIAMATTARSRTLPRTACLRLQRPDTLAPHHAEQQRTDETAHRRRSPEPEAESHECRKQESKLNASVEALL